MKHVRGQHTQTHRLPLWGVTLGLLLLCAFDVRAQSAIDLSVVASGGTSQQGPQYDLYSTVGEPITTDSLGASDETTWGGFWQVMPAPGSSSSVDEEQLSGATAATGILRAAPSPFASSTAIQLQLAQAGVVTLTVYDLLGREVERLVEGHREAGVIRITWRPEGINVGNYFIRLDVDGQQYPGIAVQYYR